MILYALYGAAIFFRAIPTYGVLPYSMRSTTVLHDTLGMGLKYQINFKLQWREVDMYKLLTGATEDYRIRSN